MKEPTVAEIVAALLEMPQDATVRAWKPGQHMALGIPFEMMPGYVYFEANDVQIKGNAA